ncbi:MAG: hypothetical protein ACREQF_01230 [Candidatus Binataceae bacterium]
MVEQSGRRTEWFNVPIRDNRGEVIVEVQCHLNTRNMNVIYAGARAGPPLSEDSINYLRSAGLCKQQGVMQ